MSDASPLHAVGAAACDILAPLLPAGYSVGFDVNASAGGVVIYIEKAWKRIEERLRWCRVFRREDVEPEDGMTLQQRVRDTCAGLLYDAGMKRQAWGVWSR